MHILTVQFLHLKCCMFAFYFCLIMLPKLSEIMIVRNMNNNKPYVLLIINKYFKHFSSMNIIFRTDEGLLKIYNLLERVLIYPAFIYPH